MWVREELTGDDRKLTNLRLLHWWQACVLPAKRSARRTRNESRSDWRTADVTCLISLEDGGDGGLVLGHCGRRVGWVANSGEGGKVGWGEKGREEEEKKSKIWGCCYAWLGQVSRLYADSG